MAVTRVTRNFQVTIPKEIRKKHNIKVGDELMVESRTGEVVLKKKDWKAFLALAGAWGKGESGLKTTRRLRKDWEKRAKRLGL